MDDTMEIIGIAVVFLFVTIRNYFNSRDTEAKIDAIKKTTEGLVKCMEAFERTQEKQMDTHVEIAKTLEKINVLQGIIVGKFTDI